MDFISSSNFTCDVLLLQPKNSSLSKTHVGLATKDRVKSLPHINRETKCHRSSGVSLSESLCSIPLVKIRSEKVVRNFIQENIRNISSRNVSRFQDSAVSCPDLVRKVRNRNDVPPHVGKGKCGTPSESTTPKMSRQVKFNLDNFKRFPVKRELDEKGNMERDVVPLITRNQSFHSLEPPNMRHVQMFGASKATTSKKNALQVLNIEVEKHEKDTLVLMRDEAMDTIKGLKSANEEALKVCLDLKSSCKCLRQICALLKEVCFILRDEKY